MASELESYDVYAIRSVLHRINDSWLGGKTADFQAALRDCFTDTVVFNGPDFREVARGREACIEGYAEFAGNTRLLNSNLGEAEVALFGDTAVACYPWRLEYELDSHTYRETGYDVFVFVRRGGRWLATWRAMVPQLHAP
jgi:ketosteroid isomerase-like protein